MIASEQKDYDEAINYFDEAIKCNKNMVEPYVQKGFILTAKMENKKAIKTLEKAAAIDSNSPLVYFLIAINYESLQKNGKTEQYLRKAINLDPKNTKFLFELGVVLDKQKKQAEAEEIFNSIIQIDTTSALAYNYLGYTYADRNTDLEKAEKYINTAIALDPDNGAYLDSLGWLYYRQKKYGQAVEQLIKASQLLEDPVVFDHIGDCYIVLGDTQMAVDNWESSYNLDNNGAVKSKIKKYGKNLIWDDEKIKTRALRNFVSISDFSGFINASTIWSKKEYETGGAIFFKKPDNLRFDMTFPFSINHGFILIKSTAVHYISNGQDNTSQELNDNIGWLNDLFGIFSENFFANLSTGEKKDGAIIFKNGNITVTVAIDEHTITEITFTNGTVIKFFDYKPAGRAKFPRKIYIDNKEKKSQATIIFKKFNGNINLTDDLFNVPERGNK